MDKGGDEDLCELKATWLDAREQHKGMTDSRFEKLRSDFLFLFYVCLIVIESLTIDDVYRFILADV